MQVLANLLKQAVDAGILTEADFYRQEQDVIAKLTASPLAEHWQAFRNLRRLRRSDSGMMIPAKKRYIDPAVQNGLRASRLDEAFRQNLEEFQNYSFAYFLSVVN